MLKTARVLGICVLFTLMCAAGWSAAQVEAPVPKGPDEISIGTFDSWYSAVSYADNLPIFQAIEKATGVKVNWDVVPPSNYSTAMKTRIAAGIKGLPDLISIVGDYNTLGRDGVLMPMEDYINEENAPHITKYFAENPLIKALNFSPDGHMYKISSVTGTSSFRVPCVRGDWLEVLGLDVPTTTQEFVEVLRAFKTQDPNRNGKADEIGYMVEESWKYLRLLSEQFGLRLFWSEGWSVDEGGNVRWDYLEPRAKEFFAWMQGLYKEGLIDPEFATTTTDSASAKISRNLIGAGNAFGTGLPTWNTYVESGGNKGYYIPVILEGPYGDKFTEAYGPHSGNFGITMNCGNPEAVIRFVDYVYGSEEGYVLCNWGLEGTTYYVDADGDKHYTDFVMTPPKGMSQMDVIRSMGSYPNIPYRQDAGAKNDRASKYSYLPKMLNELAPMVILPFPEIAMTAEEADVLGRYLPDITTYKEEMEIRFITGESSIDEFDKFVANMKKLHIDEVIKVKQQQWDRIKPYLED